MLHTFLFTCLFVAIAFLLLGVRVFFIKGGKFPNTHVGGNKALERQGITCAKNQDQEAQAFHRNISNSNK